SEVAPMLAATQPGQQAQADGAIGSLLDDWQVEIRDENGDMLPTGQVGEIAVRGGLFNPVIGGKTNTDATGWYLTGDQGFLDNHGLLHLTGRSDERINRGGEKVVPQAVENVLASSPLVVQSVVLGVPDALLGERVVALVVLSPDVEGDETELRVHCARHLPDYMVPEQIRFVDEIGGSQTGKISRRELAKQFNNPIPDPDTTSEYAVLPGRFAPASPTETQLAALFTELLEIQPGDLDSGYLDLETGFMDLGGNSLQAVCLLTRIEDQFGLLMSPADLIANGSVAALSRLIDEHDSGREEILVQIQEPVSGVSLIFTHAPMGYAFYAHTFAKFLGRDIGVYACQWRQNMPDIAAYSMEEHARQYVIAIRDPLSGPYALAGHSFRAHLAYEIARQLTEAGEQVVFLALIDDEADLFKSRYGIIHHPPESNNVYDRSRWLLGKSVPRPYKGKVDLFLAEDGVMPEAFADPLVGWGDLVQGKVTRHLVPGDHFSMMSEKHIAHWSGLLKQRLAEASADRSGYSAETIENDQAYQNALKDTENARIAAIAGNLKQEIIEYQSALKKTEDQPYWVCRNFGLALLQLGRPRAGLVMLRQAVAREVVPLPGLVLLADILKQLKRIKLFRAVIAEAERITPADTHAQLLLGELHSKHDSLQKAEACFRRVLNQQSKYPRALIGMAKVLMRLQWQDEAVSFVFQAARLRPSDTGIRILLAQLLVDVGETTTAEKILRELLATDPGHAVAQRLIAKLKAD
ncbi:thioesterase domain-containing protein, partial [Solemya elarraichensis gill symbiont]